MDLDQNQCPRPSRSSSTEYRPCACTYSAVHHWITTALQSTSRSSKQARDRRLSQRHIWTPHTYGLSHHDPIFMPALHRRATYTRAPRISSIVVQMAIPDGSVSTSRFIVLRDHSIVEHDLSSTLRNSLNSVANRREENSSTCTPTPQRPPISPKVKLKT